MTAETPRFIDAIDQLDEKIHHAQSLVLAMEHLMDEMLPVHAQLRRERDAIYALHRMLDDKLVEVQAASRVAWNAGKTLPAAEGATDA